MTDTQTHFLRQLGIYDPTDRSDSVTLIGVGGIGSFVAFGLAKMGVPNLTFIDPDVSEIHNVPNQMFTALDALGEAKVEHLKSDLSLHAHEGTTITTHEAAMPNDEIGKPRGVVVSGLDSMEAREAVWEGCIKRNPRIPLYVDGRISGQFCIAYSVNPNDPIDVEEYEKTLYSDADAEEISCTERGIIDVGLQMGSMITRLVRRHFDGQPITNITMMNQESYVTTSGAWVGRS